MGKAKVTDAVDKFSHEPNERKLEQLSVLVLQTFGNFMLATATSVILRCEGISKAYGQVGAISDLSISISKGQIVSLLGPSGCGKTTLLRLIAGFERLTKGSIFLGDRLVSYQGKEIPTEKRHVGMVFQDGALFPHLTVQQNVEYGLTKNSFRKDIINDVLDLVGLNGLSDRMPHQLSGGQQQRVALARALAPEPELLLLDEPFSNLDPSLRDQIRLDTRQILKKNSTTAIFVTHDQEEALVMGDKIAVMNQGNIQQFDVPHSIFHQPTSKFVAEFIGMADFVNAHLEGSDIVSPIGNLQCPLDILTKNPSSFEVMVRPDCLDCSLCSDKPNGTIESKEFRGASFLYYVKLRTGETVRCLLAHTNDFPLGAQVKITLRHEHALRAFSQGLYIDCQIPL